MRSRLNALKHRMTARIPVLPGEDGDAYRQRVGDFMTALAPQDMVHCYLAERAAATSWKIDRADRLEAARLAAILRAAPTQLDSRRREEVAALGRWLLAVGSRQKMEAADDLALSLDDNEKVGFRGWHGHLQSILICLEVTADGCRWLLDRWAELRAVIERGQPCRTGELVTAIHLLGQRPLNLDPFA